MSYTIAPVKDHANIFLITYTKEVTPEAMVQSVKEMIEHAKDAPHPVYQLGDWRQVQGNFALVIGMMRAVPQVRKINEEAGIIGPIIINQITNPWLRMSRDLAKKMPFGNFDMLVFESLEDALVHIDWQTEKNLSPIK